MTTNGKTMGRSGRTQWDETRFRVTQFRNRRTGSTSYRVTGWTQERERVRENFESLQRAKCRALELEANYHATARIEVPQVTSLSPEQLRASEGAFALLGREAEPGEILRAARFWLERGKDVVGPDHAPRLDDAQIGFLQWLERDSGLRPKTQAGLRHALRQLVRALGNVPLGEIDGDRIHAHIHGRPVSRIAKDNERRALSRFFSWCMERPRGWVRVNPCATVRTRRAGAKKTPEIFNIEQVKALLGAAVAEGGDLLPWISLQLFGCLRPSEAGRVTQAQWSAVDGELRVDGDQTKTKRPRVVPVNDTLRAFLNAPGGREGFRVRSFRRVVERSKLQWVQDVLRHTGITHLVRLRDSFAEASIIAGNSEAVIRDSYLGRVSKEDTKAFFALRPEDFK